MMVFDDSEMLHVYPVGDLQDHLLASVGGVCSCDCKPDHTVEGDFILVVHHSYDGREGLEWANEILFKQT